MVNFELAGAAHARQPAAPRSHRLALADLCLGDDVINDDCSAVRYIGECVSRRAGFMVSAGITALPAPPLTFQCTGQRCTNIGGW